MLPTSGVRVGAFGVSPALHIPLYASDAPCSLSLGYVRSFTKPPIAQVTFVAAATRALLPLSRSAENWRGGRRALHRSELALCEPPYLALRICD